MTKDFFAEIRISKGMTVLDVGCGGGKTTEIIAGIVGENGKVVGVDSNQNSINKAIAYTASKELKNVEYICSNLEQLVIEENTFDAIVGRRVLMYLPDPKTVVYNLTKLLKANGILGFQEHDSTSVIDKDKMPLHYKVNNWIWTLVERNGGNTKIGKDIWNIFSHKPITIESIKSKAVIQTPSGDISLAPITKVLSTLLVTNNIAPKDILNSNDLYEGLELEKRKSNSLFIRELIFFVSAKKK